MKKASLIAAVIAILATSASAHATIPATATLSETSVSQQPRIKKHFVKLRRIRTKRMVIHKQ